jgi:prolyl oligopeptidase
MDRHLILEGFMVWMPSGGLRPRLAATLVALAFGLSSTQGMLSAAPPYPPSQVDAVAETLHGVTLSDRYRWLEDQQSPTTRAWIAAENKYTEQVLSRFSGRDRISRRLGELLKVDSVGLPVARGNRYFFSKQFADRDLPVICLREGLDGKDLVLIDPQRFGGDGSKTVTLLDVSKDGTLLVYGVRTGGEDEVAVRFFDVDGRADRPGELPRARYFGVSITPDKQTLFYSRHGTEGSRV